MKNSGSRGMALERRINKCNLVYRQKKLALIEKIELGFKITVHGTIPLKSTVDYKGMVKRGDCAIGLAFDAKETKSTTSFPLSNIKSHQLEYLNYVGYVGGEAFFLIQFVSHDKDHGFLTPLHFINTYWNNPKGPKSIKYTAFDKKWLVPLDDYLKLL